MNLKNIMQSKDARIFINQLEPILNMNTRENVQFKQCVEPKRINSLNK